MNEMMESVIQMLDADALRNIRLTVVPYMGVFDIYTADGDECLVMGCTEAEAKYIVSEHNKGIGK